MHFGFRDHSNYPDNMLLIYVMYRRKDALILFQLYYESVSTVLLFSVFRKRRPLNRKAKKVNHTYKKRHLETSSLKS